MEAKIAALAGVEAENTPNTDVPPPPLRAADLSWCEFGRWYPLLKKNCVPSRVLPLPGAFVAYLSEDDFLIPGFLKDSLRVVVEEVSSGDDCDEEKENEGGSSSHTHTQSGVEKKATQETFFPELMAKMQTAMAQLKGAVFVRMAFKSLQDAKWIMPTQTLKCTSVAEILLLIKGSEDAQSDLCGHLYQMCNSANEPKEARQAVQDAYSPVLVLQKFSNLFPSRHFRCFVKSGVLVAVCQRDEHHAPELKEASQREALVDAIDGFFEEVLLPRVGTVEGGGKTEDESVVFGMDDLIVDVYVTVENNKVYLIDVHPYADVTDTLMFTWAELEGNLTPSSSSSSSSSSSEEDPFVLRLVPADEVAFMHTSQRDFNMSDIATPALATDSAAAIESLIRIMQMQNENDEKEEALAKALLDSKSQM